MKRKLALNIFAAATFVLAPVSHAGTPFEATENPNHVPGEKLDSGLGELSQGYDAAEYNDVHVAGEKLDSGLGALSQADVLKYVR